MYIAPAQAINHAPSQKQRLNSPRQVNAHNTPKYRVTHSAGIPFPQGRQAGPGQIDPATHGTVGGGDHACREHEEPAQQSQIPECIAPSGIRGLDDIADPWKPSCRPQSTPWPRCRGAKTVPRACLALARPKKQAGNPNHHLPHHMTIPTPPAAAATRHSSEHDADVRELDVLPAHDTRNRADVMPHAPTLVAGKDVAVERPPSRRSRPSRRTRQIIVKSISAVRDSRIAVKMFSTLLPGTRLAALARCRHRSETQEAAEDFFPRFRL